MTLAVLGSRTVGLRHLKLAPAVETGPSGVPGRLRIVDPATQDDVLSLALEATATFDLDCLVLDARDDSELAGFTTIWSTSDAGVATVDADGVVTGVAAGTCTITASVTGAGGAPVLDLAALTVASPPAVATLEQSGTTLTGTVGGSGSFTVQPRDGSGNALAGREVIAASNDTGIATVSVSGYTVTVTFVAAGTCTVVPTCETVDGAGVAVTSADASSDHPHEPVGAVQRARHTFASTSEDGWSSFGAAYLKSDWGAAPRSPPSYIQFNKKSGVATYSSFDPGSFEKSLGVGYAKVYLDFFFQLSDAFQGHTSLTNKLGPFLCYAGGAQIFLNARGADAAPLYARVRLQGCPPNKGGNNSSGEGDFGGSTFEIVRGHRIRWQVRIELNSVFDATDGVISSWLTDIETGVEVQTVNKTNACFLGTGSIPATATGDKINVVRDNAIWGGTGGTVSSVTQIRHDDLYLSSY